MGCGSSIAPPTQTTFAVAPSASNPAQLLEPDISCDVSQAEDFPAGDSTGNGKVRIYVAKSSEGHTEIILESTLSARTPYVAAKVPNGELLAISELDLKMWRLGNVSKLKVRWKEIEAWANASDVQLQIPALPADFDMAVKRGTSLKDFANPVGSNDTVLTYLLRFQSFVFVSGNWLLSQGSRTSPLPRRQDLPGVAFVNLDDVVSYYFGAFVIVLSYGWISRGHPDPDCWHLKVVSHVLRVFRNYVGGAPDDFAFFWDFFSLEQCWTAALKFEKRSREQQRRFEAALGSMHVIYGNANHVVWRFNFLPDGILPIVDERGWPHFEKAIFTTAVKSTPDLTYEYDDWHSDFFPYPGVHVFDDRQAVLSAEQWDALHRMHRESACVPVHPTRFRSELVRRKFTGNGDMDAVMKLFEDVFYNVFARQEHFPWSPREFASAEAFLEVFNAFTHVTDVKWEVQDVSRVGLGLQQNRTLQRLNLSQNQITDVSTLGPGLQKNQTLQHLNLSENQITDVSTLGPGLQQNGGLQHLDLSQNQITDVSTLGPGLQQNRTLQHFDLGCNQITDVSTLGPVLQQNQTLQHLILFLNQITDVSTLGPGLQQNGALRRLNLRCNQITDVSTLGPGLQQNGGLQHLDLSRNQITDVSTLGPVLQKNQTLQDLDLSQNQITEVSTLGPGLQQNQTLQHLNLSENQITDVSTLGPALQQNQTLKFLNLRQNQITDVSTLGPGLQQNQGLLYLYLSENPITDVSALGLALQHNRTLGSLYLRGAQITDFSALDEGKVRCRVEK